MQNFGPLVQVDTIVAGIDLDIQRALYYPQGAGPLVFVKSGGGLDGMGWGEIKTINTGFSRLGDEENVTGDGATVRFDVADLDGTLAQAIRDASHILFQGVYYDFTTAPAPPPDQAQVYELTCATRTLKRQYMSQRR